MTPLSRRYAACERARVWATLLPDGELSLFERRLLEAHCGRCAECRQILDTVGAVTELVRDTQVEEMDRHVRIVQPRYWRSASGVLASGGAAALALALALWVAPHTQATRESLPAQISPVIVYTPEGSAADSQAIWQLKRGRGAGLAGLPDAVGTRHPGPVLP